MSNFEKGSGDSFGKNWTSQQESLYTHWTREEPQNQIQLAFRRHWILFQEILGAGFQNRKVLEVGCGRGTISAYFADAGHDCTLLDLSPDVIQRAEQIFSKHGLKAKFAVGDAARLPFEEASFDLVFSIGLLEHFEDIEQVVSEQHRVLSAGGFFLGYVVPDNKNNVQKNYEWINEILRSVVGSEQVETASRKSSVFRSDAHSGKYMECMKRLGFHDVRVAGVYPLPMISYSPAFPFSLLNPEAEQALVRHFRRVLEEREKKYGRNPWLCEESYGQAFLVWGLK
jgi:ubiquinone/menaquinone biosynthesis C-methylase UbiE